MTVVVVEAMVTVTVTAVEVLDVKVESPEYTAVIESLPTGSAVVSRVATPSVQCPSARARSLPLKNSTVPVGVPVAGLIGATVAVKVTVWP